MLSSGQAKSNRIRMPSRMVTMKTLKARMVLIFLPLLKSGTAWSAVPGLFLKVFAVPIAV